MRDDITVVPANQATCEDELRCGSHWVFADAGFTDVAHPTLRRLVMRIGFEGWPSA